jgi:uncharacterized membrane protein
MDILVAIAMGVSLAACAGLRAFLPLLAVGVATRLHVWHVEPWYAWVGSNEALACFGVAAVVEILADKVPGLDHALDVFHTFARPVAGSLVAMGAFHQLPPAYAVALGIIVGAPVAGGFHLTKAGTRVASSGMTLGLANPILSALEDVTAIVGVVLSLVAPIFTVVLLLLVAYVAFRWLHARRRKRVVNSP